MNSPHSDALSADVVANDIRSLMTTQVQSVLATSSPTGPSQHLMAYAFASDLGTVYIASLRNTEKVDNMQHRPAVSMFWDNRTGNTTDHVEGIALMATGQAALLDHDDAGEPASAMQQRNSSLADLLNHADCAIIAIRINRYRLVRGYTSIIHYDPTAHAVADASTRRT